MSLSERFPEAFNCDDVAFDEVQKIIGDNGLRFAVETGTYKGQTTQALAHMSPKVYTIEIRPDYQRIAMERCADCKNIEFLLGSSVDHFPRILKEVNNDALFFLDAHGEGSKFCPLWLELEMIAAARLRPKAIVIHDFQSPDHPEFTFDSWNGMAINFDNVRKGIEAIYGRTGYFHFVNDVSHARVPPAAGIGVGYFVNMGV
jgi:hypothetical protein